MLVVIFDQNLHLGDISPVNVYSPARSHSQLVHHMDVLGIIEIPFLVESGDGLIVPLCQNYKVSVSGSPFSLYD